MLQYLEPLMFAILTLAILGSGLAVVLAPRITTSALAMAFAFLNMAGMFVLLGAETIAAFQVLIYVGAITVLILYGVMFTPQQTRGYGMFFQGQTPLGALLAAVVALPVVVIAFTFPDAVSSVPPGGDLAALGTSVFLDFAFPFEIASVLLLAAMIGSIVLVKRERELSGPPGSAGDPQREGPHR